MAEKPTEMTYAGELAKVISEPDVGGKLGFDAEVEKKTPSGRSDVILYYNGSPVCVIEVKGPDKQLSDPGLNAQALRYAEWYRVNRGLRFYALHNMRYLKLFRYEDERQPTLLDYIEEVARWAPVSEFPFEIMGWVKSIDDYKAITSNEARENLRRFLLNFRELLEGKLIDLSGEVIYKIRHLIEEGASSGLPQFENKYRESEEVKKLVKDWMNERGVEAPRNDNELRALLNLLLKEQLYTFTMRVLFYLVLQSLDADMASKLQESMRPIENYKDPEMFKRATDALFQFAIDKTGDFEEIFGANKVDRLPLVPAVLPKLEEMVRYLDQIRWGKINVDVIGKIFERLIHEERRHLLGQHYTDTRIVDLILTGVFKGDGKPDRFLDPACGSGTFLVRALNYWRTFYGRKPDGPERSIYDYVEGILVR